MKKLKISDGTYEYKGFVLDRKGNNGWNFYWSVYGSGYLFNDLEVRNKLREMFEAEDLYNKLGNRYFQDVTGLRDLQKQIDIIEDTEYYNYYTSKLNELYTNPTGKKQKEHLGLFGLRYDIKNYYESK